ncbi:hypothetical protein TRFO_33269 [Tritrichomonas foetus]|uniref:Tc1-like transposase DDE domain-containing protein n=1 Tax=Tritrichomonas foetus TaxID=1144522 RepID=A0A1J4JSC1_9EUKA|nr:hypothetical protein TRFO_33269 [Tritrichomonas foetus]|eukprot:OHT00141.1 hypothetical protein TRFO_33269 [Tritrichomonas foetus]
MTKKSTKSESDRIRRALHQLSETHQLPQQLVYGRPKQISSEIPNFVCLNTELDPRISYRRLQELVSNQFHHISIGTLHSIRNSLRFRYRPPKQKQMLTELQKFKRVSFAYSMIKNELCRNIVFSDESRFSLGPDNRWDYRRYGDEHPAIFAERQKFNNDIMIFGAIGENFKSRLFFHKKTVDQKSYIQSISQNGLLDDMNNHFGVCNYIFQQDGAPAHTGRLSTTYLKYHLNYRKIWPANSPDTNVIENIRGIMKKILNVKNVRTIQELKETVSQIWDQISIETINRLVESFRYRLYLVISNNGESIQHLLRHNMSDVQINLGNPW